MPKYWSSQRSRRKGSGARLTRAAPPAGRPPARVTESLGEKLEAFCYAFGDRDVYSVVELPVNVTAAASMTVDAAGVHADRIVGAAENAGSWPGQGGLVPWHRRTRWKFVRLHVRLRDRHSRPGKMAVRPAPATTRSCGARRAQYIRRVHHEATCRLA